MIHEYYYYYFDRVILISLLIQLLFFMRINQKILRNNLEVFFFILVLCMNHVGYFFFDKSEALFMFYHASSPIAVLCSILLKPWNKNLNILLISIVVVIVNLFVTNNIFFIVAYLSAISLTIQKANKMVKLNSNEIHKSMVYLVIALDLLFTLIIFIQGRLEFDWHEAKLVKYMTWVNMIVFTITTVVLNVKLRRFFIN